ncbi:hypothetical protein F0562_012012 [Nyssa sinensis]|uniref:Uncharacterized protein n=1 Tax=Nyssa sinensis TaxID=561372 RepID=A0A5J4ZTD0_9ASTE|nr:hypothetical protein F0562_012012 [Nyssa sinensis]
MARFSPLMPSLWVSGRVTAYVSYFSGLYWGVAELNSYSLWISKHDGSFRELLAGAYLDGSGLGRTIRNPGGGELTGGAEGRAPWEQLEEKSP